MVCDYATCKIDDLTESELKVLKGVGLTVEGDTVKSYGKSAHGSTPEMGENALKRLFIGLGSIGVIDLDIYSGLFLNEDFFSEVKDETGKLTFSPDVCFIENKKLKVQTDIRYPATFSLDKILELVSELGEYKILHEQAPIICDKDGNLVKTLLDIYNKEYNASELPIAIGGGTYARALKNGVAFGPSMLTDNMCHVPNERMKISNMLKCYNVYYKAIEKLTK
jgi:succinyl-diaminopimelate desuccinylase